MKSNKTQVLQSLQKVHAGDQKRLDERILAYQVNNMARMRLVESILITLPWIAIRKTILPRFGFITTNPLIGTLLNLLPGLAYLKYKETSDLDKYLRLLGLEDKEQEDMEYRQARKRYVNQFWTNSQYWH